MAHWAVIIPADQWATERLFQHDTLTVPGAVPGAGAGTPPARGASPAAGDEVLLVAGEDLVALGRVESAEAGAVVITYTGRVFDEPVPAEDLKSADALTAIEPEVFQRLAGRLGGDRDPKSWLVSVALPIEATSPAEAVRRFWSHVLELGPAELPAYVWPSGDELAMQAFVLGAEANQDPEEDDEHD